MKKNKRKFLRAGFEPATYGLHLSLYSPPKLSKECIMSNCLTIPARAPLNETLFTHFLLTNSLIADSGIDFENPRPLHVFVGVLTSFTTTFFCMASDQEVEFIVIDE